MGEETYLQYCQFLYNDQYCSIPNSAHISGTKDTNSSKKVPELKYKYLI